MLCDLYVHVHVHVCKHMSWRRYSHLNERAVSLSVVEVLLLHVVGIQVFIFAGQHFCDTCTCTCTSKLQLTITYMYVFVFMVCTHVCVI